MPDYSSEQYPQQNNVAPRSLSHLQAHLKRLAFAGLGGNEAAIHAVVVPRIVAVRQISDNRGKLDGLLQTIPDSLAQHP